VARLDRDADKPASPEQRRRLQVGDAEPVRYRHVRLACGDHVLSEADNWYLPGRLAPDSLFESGSACRPHLTAAARDEPLGRQDEG